MKKMMFVTLVACLANTVYAKNIIEHIRHVQKQKHSLTSTNPVNFSGHWVGQCGDDEMDATTVTIDIAHQDDQFSVFIDQAGLPSDFKMKEDYILNSVKNDGHGSPKNLQFYTSYAKWLDDTSLSLSFHQFGIHTSSEDNNYSSSEESWSHYSLSLKGDTLTLTSGFLPDEMITCEFKKQ